MTGSIGKLGVYGRTIISKPLIRRQQPQLVNFSKLSFSRPPKPQSLKFPSLHMLGQLKDVPKDVIDVSMHHVIPYSLIVRSYKKALEHDSHTIATSMQKFFAGLSTSEARATVTEDKIKYKYNRKFKPSSALVWNLGYNLFLGPNPKFRGDDPRNKIDYISDAVDSDDPLLVSRLQDLEHLGTLMTSFLEDTRTTEALLGYLYKCQSWSSHRYEAFIRYGEVNWQKKPEGKFCVTRHLPTYRIREHRIAV